TLGANSGDISHTSTGATTKNVTLTGNVLAAEPTVQSSITFGLITNNSIVVNFGGGNGARRILLAKLATAVNSDPVDGTTYTANANFGSGTQIGTGNYVVYDGAGGTQLVTGLTAGATYHFAIYDYNDGGVAGAENYLVPGGINNTTVASYSVPYVWIGLNNGLWTNPLNWLPTRLFPATNDSLLFIDGMLDTVLNVPTQSVGYIGVSLNTRINLQAGASGNTLTVGNLTGTDLFVEAGSQLNISSANNLTIQVVTGATASISGSMRFTAGVHKMIAADASAVTFNSGSVFTAGTGFTSNPFGPLGTTANSVIFTNGSRFDQISGGNPFVLIAPASIVVFQTGSLFRMLNNQLPSLSGRTYADLEIDAPGFSQSGTGTNLLTVDNLTVTQGILNINLTGSPVIFGGVYIKGNINVAPGQTLTFTPVSLDTITFNGTAAQSINNSGTFSIGPFVSLIMNNAAGLTVNTNLTMGPTTSLTLTSGVISLTPVATTLLSLGTGTVVTGASNASFVNGKVKKTGNTLFTFPVGKTNCGVTANKKGYAPVTISNFVGTSASTDTYTVEYIRGSARALGGVTVGLDHVSACDYWTLDVVGAPTVDLTLSWQDSINNCTTASPYVNNLPALVVAHFDGATWNTFGAPGTALGNAASGTVTYPGVSVFSPFAIGSIDFSNPLPITINYFTGTKNNGSHLLNWKVTCVSTPSATIEVERSIDGRNYSSIYSINATALRCQQPFDYADNQPAKGVNYYRLKMTDVDGKITYSTVVSLINASKGIDVMNIAPNPIVNGRFNLKVSAAEKVQMQLQITDMQGRILQTQAVSMIAGFNSIPVNVRNLSAGTYQLFGNTDDGRTRVLRFVIQ
ncbi:MAG: T9SS type A sorting domain-containing protein, partial [Ferruginibacter sp.]